MPKGGPVRRELERGIGTSSPQLRFGAGLRQRFLHNLKKRYPVLVRFAFAPLKQRVVLLLLVLSLGLCTGFLLRGISMVVDSVTGCGGFRGYSEVDRKSVVFYL